MREPVPERGIVREFFSTEIRCEIGGIGVDSVKF